MSLPKRAAAVILTVLILLALLAAYASSRLRPQAVKLISAKAKHEATLIVNRAILELCEGEENLYSSLITPVYSDDGSVVSLGTDMERANRLKSTLAVMIADRIPKTGSSRISIPLGNVTGSIFLEGRGPYIPVKVTSVSALAVNMKSSFSSAGINQTLHTLSVSVDLTFTVAMPGESFDVTVSDCTPIAETVIVGKVPGLFSGRQGG